MPASGEARVVASGHVPAAADGTEQRVVHVPFNIADWLVHRHVVAGNGARVALSSRGEQICYAELAERVAAVAGALQALGVEPEQRVMIAMSDGPEFAAAFAGAAHLGAVPLPVNPRLPGTDLAAIAVASRARIGLISSANSELATTFANTAPEMCHIVVAGLDRAGRVGTANLHNWDRLLAAANETPPACDNTRPDSPGYWLCTSGTTGLPKLAMHRQIDVRHIAELFATDVLGATSDDRFYSVAPMFHAYGLGNSLVFPFAFGALAVLEPTRPPTPEVVARVLLRDRPTLFFSVPSNYAALLAADMPADAFASVRVAVSAGEPLPEAILERFRGRFGVDIVDGIGSTELAHTFISNRPGDVVAGSSGTVVAGYDVRLVDEHGSDVARGEEGRLLVRGPTAATGYWCQADLTKQTFVGDWVRTGDLYAERAGHYFYLGRADNLFKVNGEWVSPEQVEAVLLTHPRVREAAVLPVPTTDGVLRVGALVVPAGEGPFDPEAVIDYCRTRLAGFKRPVSVEVVDQLPRTETGKIKRRALQAPDGQLVGAP